MRIVHCIVFFAGLLLLLAPPSRANGQAGPANAEMAALGRKLFFDPALSASGKLACSTCHDPAYAYGPKPGQAIASGGKGMNQPGTRAVPSLRYLETAPAFTEQMHFQDGDTGPAGGFTWDGRAATIHEQAQLPLLAMNEMANADAASFAAKLHKTTYAAEFRKQFGDAILDDPQASLRAATLALEAFQRTPSEFFPYNSKYDAYLAGKTSLSEAETRGLQLYKDPAKGNCASCHPSDVSDGHPPVFTDFDFNTTGTPRNPAIAANRDAAYYDLGLCGPLRPDLGNRKDYCGLFRAPGLRNSALRDGFFHNAVLHTLDEVVRFYVTRDIEPERWYPRAASGKVQLFDDMPPYYRGNVNHEPPFDRKPGQTPALSDEEIADVVAFLETLTDGYKAP